MKAHEVYSKNNWQKSIGSLMLGQGELKSSVHMGGDKRMTETCHVKLNLLDKVGRNIHESFVQNQNHNASDYEWHPSTSEF